MKFNYHFIHLRSHHHYLEPHRLVLHKLELRMVELRMVELRMLEQVHSMLVQALDIVLLLADSYFLLHIHDYARDHDGHNDLDDHVYDAHDHDGHDGLDDLDDENH